MCVSCVCSGISCADVRVWARCAELNASLDLVQVAPASNGPSTRNQTRRKAAFSGRLRTCRNIPHLFLSVQLVSFLLLVSAVVVGRLRVFHAMPGTPGYCSILGLGSAGYALPGPSPGAPVLHTQRSSRCLQVGDSVDAFLLRFKTATPVNVPLITAIQVDIPTLCPTHLHPGHQTPTPSTHHTSFAMPSSEIVRGGSRISDSRSCESSVDTR